MIMDFIIPLISIMVAEFGDKTQIAIVSMSLKYKNSFQIFFGVMLAFFIIDGLAIYFAKEISDFISIFWLKIISGLIFIFFGIIGFYTKNEIEDITSKKSSIKKFKSPFLSIFIIILFAEFGDKSQIVAGLFATIYDPILVFIGVLIGLSFLTLIAIFFGNFLFKKFNKNKLEVIANYSFILLGLITIFSILI